MNHDFFKIWTPDSAYTVGFLMADGSIRHKDYCKTKGYYIDLALHTKDIEVLEYIKDIIQPTSSICHRKYTGKDNIYRTISYLAICSKLLVSDIMKLGVIPRKTGREIIPNIDNINFRHFLRGYFDGDGSVSFGTQMRKDGGISVNNRATIVSGSHQFLIDLKLRCCNIGNKVVRRKNSQCSQWTVRSKKDLIIFYNLLYDFDNIFYLRRKRQIFNKIIDSYKKD